MNAWTCSLKSSPIFIGAPRIRSNLLKKRLYVSFCIMYNLQLCTTQYWDLFVEYGIQIQIYMSRFGKKIYCRRSDLYILLKGLGRSNEPYVTKSYKFCGINGIIFIFYFYLLIEISPNYFLNTSLDFPTRIVIFGFYSKMD